METFDVIVLGGGAAGLMCGLTAGRRGRRVLILEGSNRIGKKILMSGGGRCNFTNLHTGPDAFISANPHFVKSALARYTQWDFIDLVERHDIPYHEKTLGQLFCDRSSKDIVAMLARECADAGVDIRTLADVRSVRPLDSGFAVIAGAGDIEANAVVVATGGLSIPKMGATGFGYALAKQFGLATLETRAGLVPFTFTGDLKDMSAALSGVSVAATIATPRAAFAESILFTHRGLSGPAALQASSYWLPGEPIEIDFLPQRDPLELFLAARSAAPRSKLRALLSPILPNSLVAQLEDRAWPDVKDKAVASIATSRLERLARGLSAWTVKPAATEGYRTAEVTLGGVDTRELSSQTMEAKRVPGLYFIGEVVDVTGHLGGHNFQWAWASGFAAGQAV